MDNAEQTRIAIINQSLASMGKPWIMQRRADIGPYFDLFKLKSGKMLYLFCGDTGGWVTNERAFNEQIRGLRIVAQQIMQNARSVDTRFPLMLDHGTFGSSPGMSERGLPFTSYILTTGIQGRNFDWLNTSPDYQTRLAEGLGYTLADFHEIMGDPNIFGNAELTDATKSTECAQTPLMRKINYTVETGVLAGQTVSAKDMKAARQMQAELDEFLTTQEAKDTRVVLHNDAHHLAFKTAADGTVLNLTDFKNLGIGPRAFDFAYLGFRETIFEGSLDAYDKASNRKPLNRRMARMASTVMNLYNKYVYTGLKDSRPDLYALQPLVSNALETSYHKLGLK